MASVTKIGDRTCGCSGKTSVANCSAEVSLHARSDIETEGTEQRDGLPSASGSCIPADLVAVFLFSLTPDSGATVTVTVTVQDVNEAPTITATGKTAFTYRENGTATIYTFKATDPEGGGGGDHHMVGDRHGRWRLRHQ